MTIHVVHYSGDRIGGAARAAVRLHHALGTTEDIESRMMVAEKRGTDPNVREIAPHRFGRLQAIVTTALDAIPRRLASRHDGMPRSTALTSRLQAREIDDDPSDIAHLHWINGGLLSIKQIGQIRKPIVWTLHDMWPFCGAEHLSPDTPDSRWRMGYPPAAAIPFFDVDRWTWRRKNNAWKRPMHIVAPSQWMADCARNSALFRDFPVYVLPNTLDLKVFKPRERTEARVRLGLPAESPLVLFGAIKGTQLPYKGWDLLMPALQRLAKQVPNVEAVIFGQGRPEVPPPLSLPLHWMGHVSEDAHLADLYSAADVLLIPSRQESFGQTGSEAHACGCPVIAFNATGLRDVVEHQVTGLLARPYDPMDFADATTMLLRAPEIRRSYGAAARRRAERLWSHAVVAARSNEIYKSALGR